MHRSEHAHLLYARVVRTAAWKTWCACNKRLRVICFLADLVCTQACGLPGWGWLRLKNRFVLCGPGWGWLRLKNRFVLCGMDSRIAMHSPCEVARPGYRTDWASGSFALP